MGVRDTAMSLNIEARLAALPKMSKTELLAIWSELFGGCPPRETRRDTMIKFVGHRMQEQAYGGLKPATRKRLNELTRKFEANPNADLSDAPRIKPGTRLIRDWRGQTHRVTVLEKGYEYAGKRHASLSLIARLITGTRWSGPLFFGLKDKHAKEHEDARRT